MDDLVITGGRCHHRDAITLAPGTVVLGCSYPLRGYQRDEPPDFGLYLDARWQPPWPHAHLEWPDFGLPADDRQFETALNDLMDRARHGATVEIGCLGGHGRTGTALACLSVLSGLEGDPVDWVRAHYCDRAVETAEQEDYARRFLIRQRRP